MPKANSPNKSPPLRSTVASLRSIAGHQRVGKNFGRMSLVTGDDDKDREDEVDTRNLDVSLMEKIAACPDEGTVLRRVEDWISNLEYKYAGRCFRQCRQSPRRALSRCTKRTLWSSRTMCAGSSRKRPSQVIQKCACFEDRHPQGHLPRCLRCPVAMRCAEQRKAPVRPRKQRYVDRFCYFLSA